MRNLLGHNPKPVTCVPVFPGCTFRSSLRNHLLFEFSFFSCPYVLFLDGLCRYVVLIFCVDSLFVFFWGNFHLSTTFPSWIIPLFSPRLRSRIPFTQKAL